MKKVLNFLRSMRFGVLLLGLIALFSLLGSLIPQEREYAWYVENYGSIHWLLLFLQLNRVFKSWYFVLLLILLGLNLTLCSLVRIVSVVRGEESFVSSAAALPDSIRLTEDGVRRLEEHLKRRGCRRTDIGETRVYCRNRLGRYGSFLTHLSILLTVVFGAAALYLPRVNDLDCMPGESVRVGDKNGMASFSVASFRTEDRNGRLDYASELTITLPDGRSRSGEIRVNHPMSFGPYKVYQQSYGVAASITVTNRETGGEDTFLMSEYSFLSMDNVNGLWFLGLYPDYLTGTDGEIRPVPASAGVSYDRPVCAVQIVDGERSELLLLFPGDVAETEALRFRINDPVPYPGLRIKRTPPLVSALLIASFLLLIAGLYVTLFLPPVLVKVDAEGCAVGGPKPEGTRLELQALLREDLKEEKP